MSRIIDGKAISAAVKARIQSEVSALSARGVGMSLPGMPSRRQYFSMAMAAAVV